MRTSKLMPVLAVALVLVHGACSQDAPGADPGGQGAGRPDTAGSVEASAQEVLGNTGHPERQDSSAAGGPSLTGTLRDSLNDGEAIRGVEQPQPDRPGF